jgi:COX assembly protein 2
MHPPLFQPHPLCKQEVEDLVRCHSENPYLKFVGVCNDAKSSLDMCFREEKVMRRQLNKRVSTSMPSVLKLTPTAEAGKEGQ